MNGLPCWLGATLLLTLALPAPAEPGPGYSKRFPAKWLERDSEIRLNTVCYNYPESSYMYRLCRTEAANTLQSRCQRYRTVHERDPDSVHYAELADKYCEAARFYRPFPEQKPPEENNGQ